jgi:hypothetical protein
MWTSLFHVHGDCSTSCNLTSCFVLRDDKNEGPFRDGK